MDWNCQSNYYWFFQDRWRSKTEQIIAFYSWYGTSRRHAVLNWSVYLCATILFPMYQILPVNSLSIKSLQENWWWNGHYHVLIWTRSKIFGQFWRWNYKNVASSITKHTNRKQLKLIWRNVNLLNEKKKSINNRLWTAVEMKEDHYIKMLMIQRFIICVRYLFYYRSWSIL